MHGRSRQARGQHAGTGGFSELREEHRLAQIGTVPRPQPRAEEHAVRDRTAQHDEPGAALGRSDRRESARERHDARRQLGRRGRAVRQDVPGDGGQLAVQHGPASLDLAPDGGRSDRPDVHAGLGQRLPQAGLGVDRHVEQELADHERAAQLLQETAAGQPKQSESP